MHAEAGEGFDVRVAVVEAVDVLVQSGDVDEPVGEVEVELPVERHPEGSQAEDEEVLGTGGGLLVGHEGDPVGGAAVDVDGLPDCVLEDPEAGVPHVVHHLPHPVRPPGLERPLGPVEDVEDHVPEPEEPEGDRKVDQESQTKLS